MAAAKKSKVELLQPHRLFYFISLTNDEFYYILYIILVNEFFVELLFVLHYKMLCDKIKLLNEFNITQCLKRVFLSR